MPSGWTLRPLQLDDCEAMRDIFNFYVERSFAAYAEHPLSLDDIETMLASTRGYPAWAAEDEGGDLLGFSFLRPYSPHDTFAGTAVITTFISASHTGQGLGSAFLARLEAEAREQAISHILAHISSKNEGSQAFHLSHGFIQCGRFRNIGHKQGQPFDVLWFEKLLLPSSVAGVPD